MNTPRIQLSPRALRGSLAGLAAAVLVAGASWGSLAAGTAAPEPQAATSATPAISHSVAAGRDSYADIVKNVAPAVVTIRVEGEARVSPTMMPDDDFFRG